MIEIVRATYLFCLATTLAALEVEIEGAFGWAERLPTFYRVDGIAARIYGRIMNRRPLTGYHLFMFLVPVFALHAPFVYGVVWGWASEARVLSAYLVVVVTWDFLWFVLNPAFGWNRFRPDKIWWHAGRWIWRFPADYYRAVLLSLLVATSPMIFHQSLAVLIGDIILLCVFVLLTAIVVAIAPFYHRWYYQMRRPMSDQRSRAGIFHSLGSDEAQFPHASDPRV